jgi:hypothetical protein
MPMAAISTMRGPLIVSCPDVSDELILCVLLEHHSHKGSNPQLNMILEVAEAFRVTNNVFQFNCTENLINGFFLC